VGPVHELLDILERHRHAFRPGGRLDQAASALFEEAGVFEAVRASVKSATAGAQRVANLEALVASIGRYCDREKRPTLPAYLARVALDGREEDDDGGQGKVTLLTLHAAKGLEFPVVFLAGLEEGLLPHEGMQGMPPDLPEERRLAYVGITRAKRRLYLSRALARQRRGKLGERIPSRFLEDLPEHTFVTVDTAVPTGPLTGDDLEAGKAFLAQIKASLGAGADE
jgi:superfamily I DNA/RNA helicase